jgi:hypothetical protein
MIELPFITEVLTEARMFQKAEDLNGLTSEKLADLVYLMIMMLQVIRYSNPSWAANYASQTYAFNTYQNLNYSATDLANLLAALNHQDTFEHWVKVDKQVSIPIFQINRYLLDVKSKTISYNEDATFFWRLEDYLRLYSKGNFRFLRRNVGDWKNLNRVDKLRVIYILRQEFDKRMSNTDMYLWFKQSFKLTESDD